MVGTASVQTLASEAAACFETATRGDTGRDEDRYTRVRDGAPEWVTELVYAAHGDFFPDDWRYDAIRSALSAIHDDDLSEDDAGEWADTNVDAYTGARLAWLASNLNRAFYCDDAVEELGSPETGIIDRIGLGQYAESEEVFQLVYRALEERAEATEAEEAGA